MTDCPDGLMRDLLPEYVHGTLPADVVARVDGHLAGCAACRDEVALLRSVRALTERQTPLVDVAMIVAALPVAPAAPARPAPAGVPAELHLMRSRRIGAHMWQYAAAAVVVLAVGTTLVLRPGRESRIDRVADSSAVHSHVASQPASDAPATRGAGRSGEGISFGGGLSDLTDNELQSLLDQVDSMKTLPSSDPESMTPAIEVKEGGKSL